MAISPPSLAPGGCPPRAPRPGPLTAPVTVFAQRMPSPREPPQTELESWPILPRQGIRVFEESGTSPRGLLCTADRDPARQRAGGTGAALAHNLQPPARETGSSSRTNLMNL